MASGPVRRGAHAGRLPATARDRRFAGRRARRRLRTMRARTLQAVILHGVYPPQLLEATVGRLERRDPPFLRSGFPRRSAPGSTASISTFPRSTPAATSTRRAVQPPARAAAAAGPGARRARGGPARRARPRPAVRRRARPAARPALHVHHAARARGGGFIPPHFDNEQNFRPSYRHLRTLVEPHIVSFVLAFTRADAGGALEVFDLRCEPEDARFLNVDASPTGRIQKRSTRSASVCRRAA